MGNRLGIENLHGSLKDTTPFSLTYTMTAQLNIIVGPEIIEVSVHVANHSTYICRSNNLVTKKKAKWDIDWSRCGIRNGVI